MIKRLQIPNPNVQLQTIKLLSSCVANSGRPFRVALCSKAFATELRRVLSPHRGNTVHQKVQDELKKAAVEWRGFFAGDPQVCVCVCVCVCVRVCVLSSSQYSSCRTRASSKSAVRTPYHGHALTHSPSHIRTQLHIIDTTLTELARQGVNLSVSASSDAQGGKEAEAKRAREKEEEELAMALAISLSEVRMKDCACNHHRLSVSLLLRRALLCSW